jgi:hypothetical protein
MRATVLIVALIDQANIRIEQLVSEGVLKSDFTRDITRRRALASDRTFGLALDRILALTLDLTHRVRHRAIDPALASALASALTSISMLERVRIHDPTSLGIRERDIPKRGTNSRLTSEQLERLGVYVASTYRLLECLDVAMVEDRTAILDSLLIVPSQSEAE